MLRCFVMSVLRGELLKKGVALALVLLMLVIGLGMISGISRDRLAQRAFAAQSVQQSSAGPQVVSGPVISRSCYLEVPSEPKKGEAVTYSRGTELQQRAFPLTTQWSGALNVEPRRRSLYTVQTYRAALVADARWSGADSAFKLPAVATGRRWVCAAPILHVLLSDQRGIQSAEVLFDSVKLPLQSGSGVDGSPSGFSVSMSALANVHDLPETIAVKLSVDLLGFESLGVVPTAGDTQMKLASTWPHPSFIGSYLPRETSVTDEGFSASWRVSSLATEAQKRFPCGSLALVNNCVQAMAVNLVDPVNPSALSERAVKYGELFIALTFVGLGLFELLRRVKVHPVQYLLIGAALAVFFLLLLSVSEHVSFVVAYALAALGCTALIAVYAKSVLGGWRAALPLVLGCACLYAVLYLVLQSEQHALLAGSLLIFVVLAAVMISTRNIRWGSLLESAPSKSSESDHA
ncbi:MAG: cell envelope integrity protein CreD [Betaproteobacteria bacterium]|nr:MAG: cell envelope integrity protein CreD [Betaproteobacteria bacterium]